MNENAKSFVRIPDPFECCCRPFEAAEEVGANIALATAKSNCPICVSVLLAWNAALFSVDCFHVVFLGGGVR